MGYKTYQMVGIWVISFAFVLGMTSCIDSIHEIDYQTWDNIIISAVVSSIVILAVRVAKELIDN